jgi:hypothetical protein
MEGQGTCVGVSCYRKFTKKITRTKILQKMIVWVWPENDATALAPKLLIASRQAGEGACSTPREYRSECAFGLELCFLESMPH